MNNEAPDAPQPAILLVNTDGDLTHAWANLIPLVLKRPVTMLTANSQSVAREEFAAHQSAIVAIVLDGHVPGKQLGVLGLIRDLRTAGYSSHLIGTSSNEDYLHEMLDAGCSHACSPWEIPQLLVALLR